MNDSSYDIVLAGGGMAGLSLAYRALKAGIWADKRILIVDAAAKTHNDRTWCFWEAAPGPFEEIVYRTWTDLRVFAQAGREIPLQAHPYVYKMIRGIDFYQHTLAYLRSCPQVKWVQATITKVWQDDTYCYVETHAGTFSGTYLFSSLFEKPAQGPHHQYFLQHFKGLVVRPTVMPLAPGTMHLMDFRTGQEAGTTFFYTLPLDQERLFVEYTLFSKALLAQDAYDAAIAAYLYDVLQVGEYEVIETEFGVIPMTDIPFRRSQGRIIYLGSAGGDTRASTGYTFTNVQQTISRVLAAMQAGRSPGDIQEHIHPRYKVFDSTILQVLDRGGYAGHDIFTDLFTHTDARTLFRFLDADSTLLEDLRVMNSVRYSHFIQPFIAALLRSGR
ncbi:MAG: lycopene cyclase family protein [Bacteroidia bacterium]|nr:lycopene cyclase family protein [Bacteroidia bacterium]